ncbi:Aste57867_10520 [Aphanomyces stellatus]|uniref:Aste57867_10520 protein n=1 Tax=Aphanomyces stellatus TaxID=120398 RepID=A0A485KR87_9STRA|nr:hypothetical protein As57867_010480 [Aphanomyces stellatus]VFT87393.1 Aste57867_10520 [Aphanomyces stellatus]
MSVLLPSLLHRPAAAAAAPMAPHHLTQNDNASVHSSSSDDADRPSYYERNRDQVRENQRLYRESNREKIRAIHKAYYLKNRAKITKYKRERWHQKKATTSPTDTTTPDSAPQRRQHQPPTHKMRLASLLNPMSE